MYSGFHAPSRLHITHCIATIALQQFNCTASLVLHQWNCNNCTAAIALQQLHCNNVTSTIVLQQCNGTATIALQHLHCNMCTLTAIALHNVLHVYRTTVAHTQRQQYMSERTHVLRCAIAIFHFRFVNWQRYTNTRLTNLHSHWFWFIW